MGEATLRLRLLGSVESFYKEEQITDFASRKAEALLIYLAVENRPVPREVLAGIFWPENEQSRALANLSVALSSIRKLVPGVVAADRHTVACSDNVEIDLDVRAFEEALANPRRQGKHGDRISRAAAALLSRAVDLYRGDFLRGFHIRRVPEFEAWMLLEQERLRQMALGALSDLVAYHAGRQRYEEGIQTAQRLLAVDPLDEEAHRQLMMLFAANDQRAAALAQFEQCRSILDEELGVEPDDETMAIYERVASGDSGPWDWGQREGGPVDIRHNILKGVNRFIGRERELELVRQWLNDPAGRLLTILGPGGIGKSRLAREAARSVVGEFAGGVWFLSLVAVTDLTGLAGLVAETLNLSPGGEKPVAEQVVSLLSDREMCLIFDNMEHLLNEEVRYFLSRLVAQAPDLKVVVTSRERLRLRAETLLDLREMPTADLADGSAGSLFIDRVVQLDPHFDPTEHEKAIIALGQAVGGLPLAIELAAAWTRVMSVGEIIQEVQRGLTHLSATVTDIPARHRSLRAVIERSWELMPESLQNLFSRLAVFRGGFTRDAAQTISGAGPADLLELIDRSFLRRDDDGRFRRHPLLLQFGREQLAADANIQTEVEDAHARYFARFIEENRPRFYNDEHVEVLREVGAEYENIAHAWSWLVDQEELAILKTMIPTVCKYLGDRSRYAEALVLIGRSISKLDRGDGVPEREAALAYLLYEQGYFWRQTGRFADAETTLRRAISLARRHDVKALLPLQLSLLGDVLSDQGRNSEARPVMKEALELARPLNDNNRLMFILNNLGNLALDTGDYEEAREYFEEGLGLAQAAENRQREAILYNNMAIIANRLEDFAGALDLYQKAYAGFDAVDHAWGMAASSHNIGMALVGLDRYEEALEHIDRAYTLHEKIGHRRGLVGGLAVKGTIARLTGEWVQSRRYLHEALELAQEVGVAWAALSAIVDLGELDLAMGRPERAAMLFSFATRHEGTIASTRENAVKLLEELKAELPGESFRQAAAEAEGYTLEALIQHIVNAS